MDSPRDMEGWEVPVSEIRDYTYKLVSTVAIMEGSPLIATSQIDLFGFGNITAFRNRAMETPLNEREAMMLAYEGEVLVSESNSLQNWRAHWEQNNRVAVTERVAAWKSEISVVQSHAPPVHPFDSEQRLLAILNNSPYIPPDIPDDAPTLDPREYDRWFLLTLLGKPRYDDKKASKERNIRWHRMRQDPHREPEDRVDFLRSKRDNETQHHRAGRDEPTDYTYIHMSPVSTSGLTTMTPSQSYPPPQSDRWHQAYEAASPMSQPPTLAFAAGYSGWFGPPS
ncbi:hypothetical protein ARMSODRAFT_964143 [Armillaria solidipes]|uniref:Uncharacterized protein n=1 Tax=Armillaria solidipes TaxID=1076256 RepID=A0A2H3BF47_9AGAR|nr:hypothetical protein ARMSODRAFT_964143 [Armillaria solidipes]